MDNATPPDDAIIALPLFAQEAPLWVQLLLKEIASEKNGKAAVARRLGVGRAYVSRVVATLEKRSSGFPGGVPAAFVTLVLNRMQYVKECQITFQPRLIKECRELALGPAPTHHPIKMQQWSMCQRCPHKPTAQE